MQNAHSSIRHEFDISSSTAWVQGTWTQYYKGCWMSGLTPVGVLGVWTQSFEGAEGLNSVYLAGGRP